LSISLLFSSVFSDILRTENPVSILSAEKKYVLGTFVVDFVHLLG